MYTQERKVSSESDYYIYSPSTLARKLYLYPVSVGRFLYEPGYQISRNRFDSFLIMHLVRGSCKILADGQPYTAKSGEFVLLDCYQSHSYGSPDTWEALWMHFDGPLAGIFFQEIIARSGCVLTPENTQSVRILLDKIYTSFQKAAPIVESVLSGYITSILNELLISKSNTQSRHTCPFITADLISYINEHFHEPVSLDALAKKANLSPYHFTRIFARETGYTPHQYLINTRISAAKFMLKSSERSIKDIAFSTGFNSESNFCSTFKKWEKVTPGEYRQSILL
ncbi:MAG: helix-turn-helix domain-containing protein [Hominisplanchenecus sp.]